MRYEKAGLLLELARCLAASAEGLTLDEMAAAVGVGRRTVERMRDALWTLFPQMEENAEGLVKRFRIPRGLDGFFQAPTTEELVELARAVEDRRIGGHGVRAQILGGLEHKVRSAVRQDALRRMAPDIDALVRAERTAARAGPRPHEDAGQIAALRQALMALKAVRFRYDGGSRPGRARTVTPYGLLFDRINYLVAAEQGREAPVNWRLDRIVDLEVLETVAAPPEDFDLDAYAARSFGVFQEEPQDIVLRVLPQAADEGRRWRFHPDQVLTEEADGSLTVRFRSGGLRELAWHLVTWRDAIEIIAPDSLRQTLMEELQLVLAIHVRN
jgi:predicted DNA-binding transcriptional regulator YafY